MKRIISLFFAIIFASAFLTVSGYAAQSCGFYCEYTPKTSTGSLFYIDIFSQNKVGAAVSDLSFDSSIVEFREVSASTQTSTVRYNEENGIVHIAFADSGSVSGQLMRASFMALRTGDCTFTLHTVQAVDDKLDLTSGESDYSLSITLGKNDISDKASAQSSRSAQSGKSSQAGSSSRGKSSLTYADPDGMDDRAPDGGVIDVRKKHIWVYVLIGAGCVILIILTVLLGIRIGNKRKNASNDKDDPVPSPDNDQPNNDQPDNITETGSDGSDDPSA